MRSRALPLLVVSIIVCAAVRPYAQQLRKIGEMELALVGLSATVDGARPAIPKNVASGVKILINGGGSTLTPANAARLLGNFDVEGEISGPSFGETVTVHRSFTADSTGDLILPLPVMALSGEHQLSNLRIVATQGHHPLLDLQPHSVPVDVVEQVLITSVRTRPLTLQEIKDKGIVLDSDDYLGFEFTLGVLLESKPVKMSFPVVFDRQGIAVPMPQSLPSLDVDSIREPVIVPKLVPMMMKIPKLGAGEGLGLDFKEEDIKIPSLLVIPGEVGYLKQFFSAQLFVGNGTPTTANLIVRDLKGTITLPDNPDPNSVDPLSLATTVNGPQPATMTIAAVGPDGKPGTSDDVTSLRAGEQGMAEFLVRGDAEGFHNISFALEGVLDGLPTGPIPVTGTAKGGVLVRNGFFDVSFTLPTVVRAEEEFTLYATLTNKGEAPANLVSMTLDTSSMSGVELKSDATATANTILPGQAETLTFRFKALRTGQAVATYLKFDGDAATGGVKFRIGVGERGVPLSPDTLVLPASVDELPATVVATAMRVLGQAWSIANTPPNAMPAGVTRISKTVVTAKALALAEAGLRIRLEQPAATAIRDLLPDFYGPTPVDRGFDQLLRTTDAGRNFNRAVGDALASLGSIDAAVVEDNYARVAASGRDFVSFAIENGSAGADVDVRLTDATGRALVYTGADGDPRPAVTSAVIAPLGDPQEAPLFGLIAAPAAMPYTLELTGRGGSAVDLSITYPRGDGTFIHATRGGIFIGPGGKARIVIDPSRGSPAIDVDSDGEGSIDTSTAMDASTIYPSAPKFLSASIVGPETFQSAGPFGFNVALLFDRVVDEATSADRSRYSIPDNQFYSARRQLSGRLVLGTLAYPEGPYVPSSVTVNGIADLRGVAGGTETKTLKSLLEQPGAVVSGRVINGDGQLAAGVRVIYSANSNWSDCQEVSVSPFASAITDAQGRYQFRYVFRDPCGVGFRMLAIDDAHQSQRSVGGKVRTAGERITADIALLGRGSIGGIVRNLSGQPVPGAQVIAVSTLEANVGGGTITDGDGRYLINNITVGPVSIKAAKGTAVGAATGQIARAGMIAQADLTLAEGTVSISGVVETLESGVEAAAPGAVVVYQIGTTIAGVTTTAADGSYSLTAMPMGAYTIRARTAGGDALSLQGIASAGDVITSNLIIQILRNASVSGVVVYPDLTPAPRATVLLSGSGVVAEDDGTFTIEGVRFSSSSQTIRANSADGLREGEATVLVGEGQHVTNVRVTLNGIGTLDVAVIDSAGDPVRNQIVQISRTGHNVSPNDCTAFYLATTDNNGHVQFAGLEVGQVRVVSIRATATGIDIAKLDTAIPNDGAEVNGVLRFGGGGSIRGTVTNETGAPVFGANIEVTSRIYETGSCSFVPGVSHRIRTNLDGTYRVTGIPVGQVSIKASQEFYPTPIGASGVLVRDGDELVMDVRLINSMAEKLVGTVYLPDGVTPAGRGVSVTAKGTLPDVVVSTNDAGYFEFPEILPIGGYRVTVRDPASGGVAQEVVSLKAKPAGDVPPVPHNFRLKGRGTVRIKVIEGVDTAVSNALVTLQESEFPHETFEGVVEPSNQGVVTFANVREGDFSVSVSDSNGRGGRISGELLGDGTTIDVTVRLTDTGTVIGHFFMPDGVTAIPFAAVKLIANNKVIGQSTTESGDDAGAFSFTYVPAGTVKLEGLDPATGRSGVAIGQIVTNGQELTLDLKAQGLGTVTGRVTKGTTGQSGANVSVSSGTFKATTTADGNGDYSVPGVPEGAITVKADVGGSLANSATGTLVGEGSSVVIDVALQASGSITGIVTRAIGTAPAPPSIVTIKVGNSKFSTTTNELGAYRFDLIPAGSRSITVDVIGSIDTAIATVDVISEQTTDVPIQLIGVGSISGHAQDSNGSPVGGTVTLTGTGAIAWSATLTVNSDGSFSAPQVLAGPFTAKVRYSAGAAVLYGTSTGIVVPDETASVTVVLQSTGNVHGTVLRPDGVTPSIGATVTLTGTGVNVKTTTFSTGEFTLTGLPLGTYSISVYDVATNGYARVLNVTLAQNGDDVPTGTLVLDNDAVAVVPPIEPPNGAIGVSRTQEVVVNFTDPLTSASGVNVKLGTTSYGTRSLSADGKTVTIKGTWPDASTMTIEVTASVTDVFGRHPAALFTSQFTTVDTLPPTATVSPDDGDIQISVSTSIVATFSEPIANTSVDGLIVVNRSDVAGPILTGTTTLGPANVLTFVPSAPLLANAKYTVSVDGAVDASGNEQGNAKVVHFATTDTVGPVLTINSPSIDPDVWTKDNTPSISISRTDPISGVVATSGTIVLDGNSVTATTKNAITLAYAVTSPLADGTHTIYATSLDQAGNTGEVNGTFKLDATAPLAATITSVTGTATAAGTEVAGVTTITATAYDALSGIERIKVYRNGTFIADLFPPSFSATWNTDAAGIADGPYNLTARAVDNAGNTGADGAAFPIIVNNDPIVVTITSPLAGTRTRRPFYATATVGEPVSRVDFTIGGVAYPGTANGNTYTALLPVNTLPEFTNSFTATAYGLLGESSSASSTIYVDRSTPVAQWPFDDGTGLTAADISGNVHNGTLVNGAVWSALGRYSKSISFDGLDDAVTVPDDVDFDIAHALTMQTWVAPNAFGAVQSLISRAGAYSLSLENDGRVTALIYPNGVAAVVHSPSPLPQGLWSHVAATYDQTALRLYVDGVEVAATAVSGSMATSDGPVWLGRADAGNPLNGKLDEVVIYDRVRTADEISTDATAPAVATRLGGSTESSFVAVPGGAVWAWGRETSGDLGLGSSSATDKRRQTTISGLTDVVDIAAGENHVLFLTSARTVYASGSNTFGAVGNNSSATQTTPVALPLNSIVAIAAGRYHSLALRSNGDVYSWGRNEGAQQGDPNINTNYPSPHIIMTGVKAIGAGVGFSLFVKKDGTVWGIGSGSSGQLGDNSTSATPRSVAVQMIGVSGAAEVAGGNAFSIVRLENGALWAAGQGGVLGNGNGTLQKIAVPVSNLTDIVQIATGFNHTIARKIDGTVWSFGSNTSGANGDGSGQAQQTPLQVPGLSDIVDIGAGKDHSLAVSSTGVVYGWGENLKSETGDGSTRDRLSPVAASIEGYVWKAPTPTLTSGNTFNANTSTTIGILTLSGLQTQPTIRYTLTGAEPTESDTAIAPGNLPIAVTTTVSVKAFHPDMPPSNVEQQVYILQPVQPTITPNSSSDNLSPVTITNMTTSTAGAEVWYTIGTPTNPPADPTGAAPQSTKWDGSSKTISGPAIVKAAAFKPGWTRSTIKQNTYNFRLPASTISPNGGPFIGPVTATVANPATVGTTTFRWSITATNVNTPVTCSTGTSYNGSIPINTTSKLHVIACNSDYSTSAAETTAIFTLTAPAPSLSLVAGAYAPGTAVTVTGDPSATLRYTLNGVDPGSNDPIVANGGSIMLGNFTLKARAFISGMNDSAVVSADYTLTGDLTLPAIALGFEHALASLPDGRLYAWGNNFRGQLGNGVSGSSTPQAVPLLINDLTGVIALAGGSEHSLAITSDHRVWAWGNNASGQIGDGDPTTPRPRPAQVSTWTNARAIAAGPQHSLALLDNGDVYGWGANTAGALCDANTSATFNTPRFLMSGVIAISAGTSTTLMVKNDNTVWGCGLNTSGQLGDNSQQSKTSPTQMLNISSAVAVSGGATFTAVLLTDRTVRATGAAGLLGDGTNTLSKVPVAVTGLSDVIAIDAGTFHTLALKSDGSVWSWGQNANGQLGNLSAPGLSAAPVSGLDNVTQIHATSTHSMALTADRVIYGWGSNSKSEIGDGTTRQRSLPTPINAPNYVWKTPTPVLSTYGTTSSSVLNITATSTAGSTIYYTKTGADPTTSDSSIASGGTISIDATLTLKLFAVAPNTPPSNLVTENYILQPATPTITPNGGSNLTAPVNITNMTSTTAGTEIWFTVGTPSNPPEDPSGVAPQSTKWTGGAYQITGPAVVKAVAFKPNWTPSIVKQVTFNYTLPPPVVTPSGGSFTGTVNVSASNGVAGTTYHWLVGSTSVTCTSGSVSTGVIPVSTTGALHVRACHPDYSASGSTEVVTPAFTITAQAPTFSLVEGSYAPGATVVIDGDPATTIRYSMDGTAPTTTAYPTAVPGTTLFVGNYTLRAQATKTGQTASAITTAAYTLTSALGTGAVSGGRNHSALVTPDGRVLTWGRALYGRLGNGDQFTDVTTPTAIHGLTGVTAMSGQFWHNLAVTVDGHVVGWGYNADGQLGIGSQLNQLRPVQVTSLTNIVAVSTGVYHSVALSADGQVFVFGDNSHYASLGVGESVAGSLLPIQVPNLPVITAISAGFYHTMALAADGRVFTWGSNEYGQIGNGSTDATAATPVEVPGLSDIVSVSAGSYFSTATRRDGRVFVWGRNAVDEWSLGIGGDANVNVPVENTALAGSRVSAGYYAGFAQRPDGTLLGWGYNGYGQIGTGDFNSQPVPVAIAIPAGTQSYFLQDHSAILTSAGELFTAGNPDHGNLGDDTTTSRSTPLLVFTLAADWAPPAPIFSVAPGTYSNAVTLVITSSMAGSTIRYTLDGSAPDENSLEVPANGEVLINSTTTIRARVFAPNRKPGAITAGTYLIQP